MIDFSKKIAKSVVTKRIHPVEIYNNLDRSSETGPLRPSQDKILNDWFKDYREKRNAIVKLHTGEGKTLIGLLLLLSKMNQESAPVMYVCPNIYLVKQTCLEAQKFGIPYCTISGTELPDEFLSGKKILITHVQKVFNGYSIFGTRGRSIQVDSIVLDDSHACIDSIQSAFTIKISRESELFNEILSMFEDDLRNQGEGSFLDIKNNNYSTLLPIPYWCWIDRSSEVAEKVSKYAEDDNIKFVWPLVKDELIKCDGYISGDRIEIIPTYIPIEYFGTFSNAKHRVLMSATTQNDSFFIKGLGFSVEDISNTLTNTEMKWSGEKLYIIPSLISEDLERDLLISTFSGKSTKDFGVVALVTSFKMSEQYGRQGAVVANSNSIYEKIDRLKKGDYTETVVIVNRYDGIDLPDNACRILILDSKPFLDSLKDRYEEYCRPTSDIINTKIAQKIEQGMGRSVRGEKDYSVIIIIGSDLIKFIKSPITKKYFSQQMQKQLEIGLKVSEFAKEEIDIETNNIVIINDLIRQVIKRDQDWKAFYQTEMECIEVDTFSTTVGTILEKERIAEQAFFRGDFENAANVVQRICDELTDENEKGWYLQKLSYFKYFLSKIESNKLQKSAFRYNYQLLKPKDGISYKKMEYRNEKRAKTILNFILEHGTYEELRLKIDELLSNFSFGVEAEKFESAVQEIGLMLGFDSQRPDRQIRKGPDNLWCIGHNQYILIECKSEVLADRTVINKYEAGQMNSHCGWFEEEYPEAKVLRLIVIPTKTLSYYANFTHNVKILRKNKLRILKSNINGFIKEFKAYRLSELTQELIEEALKTHRLDIESIKSLYHEDCRQNKSPADG